MALYPLSINPNDKPNAFNYVDQAGLWISSQNDQWFIDAADQTEADVEIAQAEAWFNGFDHIAAVKGEVMARLNAEVTARLEALEHPSQQTMLLASVSQMLIDNAGVPVNQWSSGDQSELADLQNRLDAINALAASADLIAAEFSAMTDFWDIHEYDVPGSQHWPSA